MTKASSVLESTLQHSEQLFVASRVDFDKFNSCSYFEEKLKMFLQLSGIKKPISKQQLARLIVYQIAKIDEILNDTVNAILHHRKFQKIEATWRGLLFLVNESDDMDDVKIRFLDVSWPQLVRDMDRAIEFDQSNLFRKVYNSEFGVAGGEPYGVLLGDYFVRHKPSAGYKTDDIGALREISQVAAASFAPFITSVDPALFGLDDFHGLGMPINYEAIFSQAEYRNWNSFRETEDSRFIGLTVPRMLMRLPYEHDTFRSDKFAFNEDVSEPNNKNYLWGNACFAFGAVLIQSFSHNAWFTDIRGCHEGIDRGGVVADLPVPSFKTDKSGVALKYSTDVLITDFSEKLLSEHGFIPFCHSRNTSHGVFYGNQSVQGAQHYDKKIAEINAKMSAMLQYILCASRFAHYIKIIGRDKVGSFYSAEECENYLHKWLLSYSTASASSSEEQLAKYPLSEARVEVKEVFGKPGVYSCTTHLKPHMQLDQMVSAVKLVTELAEAKI